MEAMKLSIVLMLLCVAFHPVFSFIDGNTSLVPALYVFGDSFVDGGNAPISSHFYGIDLNMSVPLQFTNGKNIVDFIAILLGLFLVPPYSNFTQANKSTTGVNYAYGGSAILTSGLAGVQNFNEQISHFNITLTNNQPLHFTETCQLSNHLSKSIFLISFGINDYNFHILGHNISTAEPLTLAMSLLDALATRLTMLYGMGTRKFIVNDIWPMGCQPPLRRGLVTCNVSINDLIIPYNRFLPKMLRNLSTNLPDFEYSSADNFKFAAWLENHTNVTGITNTKDECLPYSSKFICQNRDIYLYFDAVHTTQAANNIYSLLCFNGTMCAPISISELVRA